MEQTTARPPRASERKVEIRRAAVVLSDAAAQIEEQRSYQRSLIC